MDLKATYNQIAEDWYKDHRSDDWWVKGTDEFIRLVGPGGRVLDVGCGAGVKSKYLVSKGLDVVGIDFSKKMIEIAEREVSGAVFRVLDLADIENLEGAFDGIFAQAVLLHVPKSEIKEKLRGLVKKLKPGGYCYVAVKEKKSDGPEEEVRAEDDYGYEYKRFFSYFTTEEIQKRMQESGLVVVYEDRAPSGNLYWLQIIGKKI